SKKGKSDKKPGGQKGRIGTTLEPVDEPDEVIELKIDLRTLPKGVHSLTAMESEAKAVSPR
ncbi:MAG: hypothetical protein AB2814_06090, partial [Candidatus Sedimenticola endophacoides]